jgi:hypothetical protein
MERAESFLSSLINTVPVNNNSMRAICHTYSALKYICADPQVVALSPPNVRLQCNRKKVHAGHFSTRLSAHAL